MSILIENMEMPEKCGNCFLRDGIFCMASNYERISYNGLEKKESWCPLVEVSSVKSEPKWIPCSERLPENRVDVLICYREWQKYAKRYVYTIVNGWYARKYSVKENVFSEWEMDSDYKEDEDEFYIPEGWYEFTTQGNGDLMNWFINAEVIAWMPLPEPYAERRTDEHDDIFE